MKNACLFLCALFSLSAFATSPCFTRNSELQTNQVTLAREICITAIQIAANSASATVSFTRDGQAATQTLSLTQWGVPRADGTVAYRVPLEKNTFGGRNCDTGWEVESHATLVVAKGARKAHVESVTAGLDYTNDNCHMGWMTVQQLKYTAR